MSSKNKKKDDEASKSVRRHIIALGFNHPESYLTWCLQNRFPVTLKKSKMEMQQEKEFRSQSLVKRDKQTRLHKNPKSFLQAVCEGKLRSQAIDRPGFKAVAEAIETHQSGGECGVSLFKMLDFLNRTSKLVFEQASGWNHAAFIVGLIKLHNRKALWVRPLDNWKPKSKSLDQRFSELVHHLFDQYGDVPRFMDSVWLRTDNASSPYRDWFVQLGQGRNIRQLQTPVLLTKKMAHHFMRAPKNYTVEQALRWGQLSSLGAGEPTIRAINATQIGRSFDNEEFWITVLRFFARSSMLDPRQIGPIVDYLHNQKFVPVDVSVAPGLWRTEPPPQPGLSLTNRTVDGLLRNVEEWHRSLGNVGWLSNERYAEAAYQGFTNVKKINGKKVQWSIRQLRSAKDLQIESRDLRHCVASYHMSCLKGNCTIWNLSVCNDDETHQRLLTIEVTRLGMIVQCRGLANRDPKPQERSIVEAWAKSANLTIAPFL